MLPTIDSSVVVLDLPKKRIGLDEQEAEQKKTGEKI
jgi:hypothetical protein